jgi:hypothetical protein
MPAVRLFRVILVCLLTATLAACASSPAVAPIEQKVNGTALQDCCRNAETYPLILVDLIEPIAPLLGKVIGNTVLRPGYLATPQAEAAVLSVVRPLDIVVLSSKGRASGNTIPGLFGHGAVYLGTEAELRALGVWNDPSVAPHQAEISAGATFIESDSKGVHLSPPPIVLDSDRIVVLRPRYSGNARRRTAAAEFAERLGMRFDYHFDNATAEELYCLELIAQVLPEMELPTRTMYRRETILPDDVVAEAAVQRSKLDLVAYFHGDADGWARSDRATLITDLNNWWQHAQPLPAATGA